MDHSTSSNFNGGGPQIFWMQIGGLRRINPTRALLWYTPILLDTRIIKTAILYEFRKFHWRMIFPVPC